MATSLFNGIALVLSQVTLACGGIGGIALMPPADGTMLILPWNGETLGQTITTSLSAGATLLGQGQLPGSIVVRGERARLNTAFAGRPILLLGTLGRACGR